MQYYNAGNDPETQLRQVHEALAEGVETLLVNLADGEDSEKVADIVGDAGVVLLNRAPGTAILNERMVFVGMDEPGAAPSRALPAGCISGRRTTGRISAICCSRGCPARRIQMPAPAPPCRACWTTASAPSPRRITRSAASAGSGPAKPWAALLEQGVDFDCVICDNDEMALGVIEALGGRRPGSGRGAHRQRGPHGRRGPAALESGKLYMTVDQNPEDQARAAVAAAVNLARGRAYDDGLRELLGNDCTDPEQPFVLRVPVEAVTT